GPGCRDVAAMPRPRKHVCRLPRPLRGRRVRDRGLDALEDALDVEAEGLQHENRDDRDECKDERVLDQRLAFLPPEALASCEPQAVCLVLKHLSPLSLFAYDRLRPFRPPRNAATTVNRIPS